jgi:hypothetical protein
MLRGDLFSGKEREERKLEILFRRAKDKKKIRTNSDGKTSQAYVCNARSCNLYFQVGEILGGRNSTRTSIKPITGGYNWQWESSKDL